MAAVTITVLLFIVRARSMHVLTLIFLLLLLLQELLSLWVEVLCGTTHGLMRGCWRMVACMRHVRRVRVTALPPLVGLL